MRGRGLDTGGAQPPLHDPGAPADSRDAHEIFLGLIRESDVFIENMVWLDKLGIHDDELLRVNPALVIVHISGFGHREFGGVPEICARRPTT